MFDFNNPEIQAVITQVTDQIPVTCDMTITVNDVKQHVTDYADFSHIMLKTAQSGEDVKYSGSLFFEGKLMFSVIDATVNYHIMLAFMEAIQQVAVAITLPNVMDVPPNQ